MAIKNMEPLFSALLDVTCFSHTLDRVGENFKIPRAIEFANHWMSLFSHSFKARLAFKGTEWYECERTIKNPLVVSLGGNTADNSDVS